MKKLLAVVAAVQVLWFGHTASAQTAFDDADDNAQGQVLESADQSWLHPQAFGEADALSVRPLFADSSAPATLPAANSATNLDASASTRPAAGNESYSASHPEATSAAQGQFPAPGASLGLGEFISHFAPYEPVYFIGGAATPNIKFQFSFRYRIITPSGPLATEYPWLTGFNAAYSQMSLWNLNAPSAPFFDTSYRPEFFYYAENIPLIPMPSGSELGLQAGVGHESNGKDGTDSRSLNIAYVRPIVSVSLDSKDKWFVAVSPKFYGYIGSLSDNPDIARYRGYTDLRIVVGERDGLQLATLGRIGNHFNRGSVQFDLTYPLTKILRGNADVSLDVQYFTGFGESLLTYNDRTSAIRIGIAIVR